MSSSKTHLEILFLYCRQAETSPEIPRSGQALLPLCKVFLATRSISHLGPHSEFGSYLEELDFG